MTNPTIGIIGSFGDINVLIKEINLDREETENNGINCCCIPPKLASRKSSERLQTFSLHPIDR
jgi:hypothetical protein